MPDTTDTSVQVDHSGASLLALVQQELPGATIVAVERGQDALAVLGPQGCSVAFVDTRCPDDTPTLIRALQTAMPHLNVIVVADAIDELAGTLELHCSGYLLRPFDPEQLRRELADLRYQPDSIERATSRFYARCFGSFELFCDGKPLKVHRSKSKELLAYLVCQQGALSSVADVESALWNLTANRSANQSYLRHLVSDLASSLRAVGGEHLLVRQRGTLGVDTSAFACDYYDYLAGRPWAPRYHGQFMTQYGWAQGIRDALEHR